MTISFTPKRNQALTLVEVIVVIALLFILVCAILPTLPRSHIRAPRIQCVNNLKQIGLSFRVWEGDHGDKFPTAVSETNGGTLEYITGQNAFRHFQVMSNELSIPKVLFCPADSDRHRHLATNFNISNANISYFIGIDATRSNSQSILGGDRNLTNGTPLKNGILEVTESQPAGWTAATHVRFGNLSMSDGSVQQLSTSGLRITLKNTSFATNRLQMP